MIRSIAGFWNVLSRVEEWFFIARIRFGFWILELTGMEEEYKELKEAFTDFLAKDRDDDAAAEIVKAKNDAVEVAMDDYANAETYKTQTAAAKAAARARVEELMDATN